MPSPNSKSWVQSYPQMSTPRKKSRAIIIGIGILTLLILYHIQTLPTSLSHTPSSSTTSSSPSSSTRLFNNDQSLSEIVGEKAMNHSSGWDKTITPNEEDSGNANVTVSELVGEKAMKEGSGWEVEKVESGEVGSGVVVDEHGDTVLDEVKLESEAVAVGGGVEEKIEAKSKDGLKAVEEDSKVVKGVKGVKGGETGKGEGGKAKAPASEEIAVDPKATAVKAKAAEEKLEVEED